MSGELGLAGYRFQYHVMVLAALELWGGRSEREIEAIVVEGRPGAEAVDYELVGLDSGESAVVQVKSRWGRRPWSARDVWGILASLGREEQRPVQLQLIANGRFSGPAKRLAELLTNASALDDRALRHQLRGLGIDRDDLTEDSLTVLRGAVVDMRSEGLLELREEVRDRLRRLRAARGCGIGEQAAEMLRAYLLGLAMDKTEATDVAGRTWHRDEFLEAATASRNTLEHALASTWGVPVGLAHRDRAVDRMELLDDLGRHLKDTDGVHAADGHVRVCVLVGPAGIGKTTLAQQYALRNAGEFDWIYQITASADDGDATAPEDVLREELEQFAGWLLRRDGRVRSGPYTSLADVARAVSEALAASSRTWLLIVDNATAADSVGALLPPAGHGVVVVTSRNSAWHSSQPLIRVGELTATQGRDLVRHRLDGMAIDDTQVDALCRELDYLPLSLVTATSYLRSTREPISAFFGNLADEVKRLDALGFSLQHFDDYPRNAVAAVTVVTRRLQELGDELSA